MTRLLLVPLLLALLPACGGDGSSSDTPAGDTAEGACDDPSLNPFAGTCVETFLADCFDPVGACTYEQSGANVDLLWENGASVHTEAGLSTTTTLTASDGTECAVGTSELLAGGCASLTTYVRQDGATQEWCFGADGSLEVRCDDGTVIPVDQGQSSGAQSCAYGNSEPCEPAR